jgi:hypothetical protein
MGDWRKLHSKKLHDVYCTPRAGQGMYWGEGKCTEGFFWRGRPEGKRPLGSAGGRCENNIEVGLQDTKWEGVDWIGTRGGLL